MQKKVLICEDDKDIVLFLEIFLTRKNYNFLILKEGKKVMPATKGNNVGVILLDLGLPDIDGAEVAVKLKKNAETKNIPLILFSAGNKVREIAEKVGADGYIRKPFNLKDLDDLIKSKISA